MKKKVWVSVKQALFPKVPEVLPVNMTAEQLAANENGAMDQAGVSLRNSLFAMGLTAIGIVAAIAVFYQAQNTMHGQAAQSDVTAVVTGLQNAYGSSGGYPASVNFQTLEQDGDFPSDGSPNGGKATFSWGSLSYTGNANGGAQLAMTITPNTAGECEQMANTLVPMAYSLSISGTSVVTPGTATTNASLQQVPTLCSASNPSISFDGG